jgi:hypothetical protein
MNLEPKLFGSWSTIVDGIPMVFKFNEDASFQLEITLPPFNAKARLDGQWRLDAPNQAYLYGFKTKNLLLKRMKKESPLPLSDLGAKTVTIHFQGKSALLTKL